MPPFLQHHHLTLTPLSPIHLGTGEDYEPTNYVISDGLLYTFDPAQADLNPTQRKDLWEAAQSGDIFRIQNFFKNHPEPFIGCAHNIVAITQNLAKEYETKLGKTVQREAHGKRVSNQLEIKRTAANPQTHRPYIPGSALKGCLRTALLERLIQGQRDAVEGYGAKAKLNETALLGSFASDGLRLLKTADLMPSEDAATQILYSVNHKKRQPKTGENNSGGVTTRCETIRHAQYRAFSGTFALQHLNLAHQPQIKDPQKSLPSANAQPKSLQQLAQDTNAYHIKRFTQEIGLLKSRGLAKESWLQSVEQLLAKLMPQLNQGRIMLIRLGKFGGAEYKTLDGLAQGKGTPPKFEARTKTIWLAAESERQADNLLPFGWTLIEIDPQGDNSDIQNWCRTYGSHLSNDRELRQKWQQQKAAVQEAKAAAAQAAKAEAEAQRRQAEAQAATEAARQAELAAMNPAERIAAEWHDKLTAFTFDSRNQQAHTELYQQLTAALQQATAELTTAEQKQLAETLSFKAMQSKQPQLFAGKREKEIKALLKTLRGE